MSLKKQEILSEVYKKLIDLISQKYSFKNNIYLLLSAEIEFYIISHNQLNLNSSEIILLQKNLNSEVVNENIFIEKFEQEDGLNQFEIQFKPTSNPIHLAEQIEKTRKILKNLNKNISFDAKPHIDQPGSAIHFHISIWYNDKNLFQKKNDYPEIFYHSISGLLDYIMESLFIMAPTENCYERFLYLRKQHLHKHYPTNCSWGFDNRTCAIRIPGGTFDNINSPRIEYRVPSSNCNSFLALIAILIAISDGIESKIDCPGPIFGNAFDPQYEHQCEEFSKSLFESQKTFKEGRLSFLEELVTSS